MLIHPVLAIFPTMDEQALRRLADDIEQRSMLDPVVTHDGVLVDGRSRILACRLARVPPRTVEWRDIYRGGQTVAQWIWAAHTAPPPVDQYIAITVAQHGHAERKRPSAAGCFWGTWRKVVAAIRKPRRCMCLHGCRSAPDSPSSLAFRNIWCSWR